MASAAERAFAALSPEQQAEVTRTTAGNPNGISDWYQASAAAGDPNTIRAAAAGNSEDFARFNNGTVTGWTQNYYDQAASEAAGRPQFRSMRGAEGFYDKPTECPPGMGPSGPNESDPCTTTGYSTPGGGGGGGFESGGITGRGGYGGAGTGFGGAPSFGYTPFKPAQPGDTTTDPSYLFRVKEGQDALERSASARGVLNTSGTLKDIQDYGQQSASQEYQNIFNRGLQTWGAQYQGEKDAFAPVYGSWNTVYGGDLSKYLQRENNIFGLINQPAPQAPYYG